MTDGPVMRVQKLIASAREGHADVRPALLRVIVDVYVSSPSPAADERHRFTELASRLIDHVTPDTLLAMAKQIAPCPHAPPAVLQKLMGLDATIAATLLERSPVLSDAILLDAITLGDPETIAAVARRQTLSQEVEAALRMRADAATLAMLDGDIHARAARQPAPEPIGASLMQESPPPPQEAPRRSPRRVAPLTSDASIGARFFPDGAIPRRVMTADDDDAQPARVLLSRGLEKQAKPLPVAVSESDVPDTLSTLSPAFEEVAALVEAATQQRKKPSVIAALAKGLGLSRAFTATLMKDESGDTTVAMVKALGLGKELLSKVILVCHPQVAASVAEIYRLVMSYDAIGQDVADALMRQWRDRNATEALSAAVKTPPADTAPPPRQATSVGQERRFVMEPAPRSAHKA